MKKIKIISINLAIITALTISGCGGGPSSNENKINNKLINISFNNSNAYAEKNGFSSVTRNKKTGYKLKTEMKIDDAFLKINLKTNTRGRLVNRYTPSQFILSADLMVLSNESISSTLNNDGTSNLIGRSLSNQGEKLLDISNDTIDVNTVTITNCINATAGRLILPKHYNMLHADKIIRNFGVNDLSYKNFLIEIQPWGNGTCNDNYYINSVVVVDLGEKYKGVNIGNSEITNHPLISIKDTEHMFPFQVLQPLPHGFFGSIIMSSEVSKPYPLVSGTGGIVLPLQKVDFSDFENPTVNLSWDMDKLLEVYDNNTPDDVDDDVITFNLSNPFPINMEVLEQPARGEFLYTKISNSRINNANTLEIIKDTAKTVITDNDGLGNSKGTIRFASNSYNVNESDDNIELQVIRESGNSGEITVSHNVIDDSLSSTGTLTWLDGDMDPKYINIPLNDDNIINPIEYFDVELTSIDTTNIGGWSKARVNVYENNDTNSASGVLFSSDYYYGIESNNTIDVKLVRVGNPNGIINIDMSTEGVSATKNIDFSSNAQTLTWDDKNMTSKLYQVTLIDDFIAEPFSNNTYDTIPPSEVYMLAATGSSGKTVLQWVNPIDTDFDYIQITRKENSAPLNNSDGDEVFKSYKPVFMDKTGVSGTDYYYLVQTVDKSGNISNGKTASKIQN